MKLKADIKIRKDEIVSDFYVGLLLFKLTYFACDLNTEKVKKVSMNPQNARLLKTHCDIKIARTKYPRFFKLMKNRSRYFSKE